MTKNPGGTETLPSGIVKLLESGSDNPDDRRRRNYMQMHMDSSGQPRADLWLAGVAATKRLAITGSLNNRKRRSAITVQRSSQQHCVSAVADRERD
jgi:hypothetical protein